MKKIAYLVHDAYGCDSGCCGHRLFLTDETGAILESAFVFDHFYSAHMSEEEWIASTLKNEWKDCEVDFEQCKVGYD